MTLPDAPQNTILVVEDFDDTREMIAFVLRQEGYDVMEAGDGRAAVEMVKERRPDLVVMDLSLPGWDGLAAAYRMREMEELSGVPIVACTAHGADTHLEAARAAGCDGFISKPVEPERLKEVVSGLLGERGGEAARRSARVTGRAMDDEQLLDYLDGLIGQEGGRR